MSEADRAAIDRAIARAARHSDFGSPDDGERAARTYARMFLRDNNMPFGWLL